MAEAEHALYTTSGNDVRVAIDTAFGSGDTVYCTVSDWFVGGSQELANKLNSHASQASRIEELTEVAAPFAKYGQILLGQKVRDDAVMVELFDTKITVGDFRKLASALALGEQSNG